MPNSRARHGEQWDTCQGCGFLFPMSQLVMQKGSLRCTRKCCFDNLEVERMPQSIMRILGTTPEEEGSDRRWVDRAFFDTRQDEL